MATPEENKATIRRYVEVRNKQDLAGLHEVFSANYRLEFAGMPDPMNLEAAKGLFGMFFAALPDVQHSIEELVGEDNKVALRMVIRGTHKGELMGVPATGKQATFGSINTFHLSDGKIVEHWVVADMLGMMQQLGVIPAPGQAG